MAGRAGATVSTEARTGPGGGEGVARASDGKLYVANGQVWVYDKEGREVLSYVEGEVPSEPLPKWATGAEVLVMHACGHDVHVTCLLGAACVN